MIKTCKHCWTKYQTETVEKCPICYYSFKKEDKISKEVGYMISNVKSLKHMVTNSCKGQPRKSGSGCRLIDPFVGHHSLKRT